MPWNPMKGERLAPGWEAAERLLKDGEWHDWNEVVDAMVKSSDLQRSTCANLLYGGIKNGHLRRNGKYNPKTKRDTRAVIRTGKELS